MQTFRKKHTVSILRAEMVKLGSGAIYVGLEEGGQME
jgi:hypothetical protein